MSVATTCARTGAAGEERFTILIETRTACRAGPVDSLHEEADMARVECNSIENVDGNIAMEEAIMGQLRGGNPAEVAVADLEKCYDVASEVRADEGDAESAATTELAAKCDVICTN